MANKKKKTTDKLPEKNTKLKKHKSKRLLFWTVVLLAVWYFNNYTLKTTETSIKSEKIISPVRAAIIGDQHATKYGITNDAITKSINSADPDIVFVLGDMYSCDSSSELKQIPVDLMTSIVSSGYPVYFVPGEHDNDSDYFSSLISAGVHVMDYQNEIITVNNNNLQIMGIDNVYYTDTFDLSTEFMVRDDCFNILLAHIPNYEKFAQFGADLTICADTHGDMVQLPFGIGPLFDENKNLLPQKRSSEEVFDKGWFDYEQGSMFITSGIGVSPAPVRFNNRPEVVIMDILPE